MLARRDFIAKTLKGIAAGALMAASDLWAAAGLAWPGPIGLELYTVRDFFAKDPVRTLDRVAAVGYQEVEIGRGIDPSELRRDLRSSGLTVPSGYFDMPKDLEDWKKSVDLARRDGLRYLVVGDNPRLDADAWKRRADFFNQCGRLSHDAGIQFCYHAHFHEFARVDGTTGYEIMLTRCDPKLLKMEMDIFWVIYAGVDPLHYWRLYPGRFPLLHIKDLRKGIKIHPQQAPASTPNPFAPVGQGRINWRRIFDHVHEAGVKHIFVEQDRCSLPEFQAIKMSYDYLRNLRLA